MLKEGDRLVTGHRLLKFLGRGNFGEVWQATAPGNTYAALKFLNLEQSHGRKEYRAIQPLKHLRHANLLQMTAIWLLDENGEIIPDDTVMESAPLLLDTVRGTMQAMPTLPEQHRPCTLIIAMPYADKSLDKLLKEYQQKGEEGIPRDELLEYMEDAAKAIDFLNMPHHDLGQGPVAIRHCDVKPENLLLMGQSVVLCDFGVSRTILGSSTTRKTGMGGSLAYMAPECLADEVTPYSDQFSLAISYLELRTGKLPFEEDSAAAVMDQRRRGILDLSALPKGEAAVIRRATSVQPDRRFGSALEMVVALKQAAHLPKSTSWMKLATPLAIVAVATGAILYPLLTPKDKDGDNGGGKNGNNGPGGNSVNVIKTLWEEPERIANEILDEPSLTKNQYEQAIDNLGKAIALDMPDAKLTFPRSQLLPNPKLIEEKEYRSAFNPLAHSAALGIASIQRRADGSLTMVRYTSSDHRDYKLTAIDDSFKFQYIVNFGWHDGKLAVLSQGNQSQVLELLPVDGSARPSPIESMKDSSSVCFCESGRNAILINWDDKKLMSLDQAGTTIALPDIDFESIPPVQLSHEGTWVAMWTPQSIFVANLTGAGSGFTRIVLGKEQIPVPAAFSIQVDDRFGWITLTEDSEDGNETMHKLIRFSLTEPSQFQYQELPKGPPRATFSKLEKRGSRICLSAGYGSRQARFLLDLQNSTDWIDTTIEKAEGNGNELEVGTIQDDLLSGARWAAIADRNGYLFLQKLEPGMPTVELAKTSSGSPSHLSMDEKRLAVGFENGGVEIFDLVRCKVHYEAAVKHKKIPPAPQPLSTVRS